MTETAKLEATVKRLQEILTGFDEDSADALETGSGRGDLWTDIEIPVGDLRTVLRAISRPAVKGLEWRETGEGFWKAKDLTGGAYEVMQISTGMAYCSHVVRGYGQEIGTVWPSPDEAKAAAQSDFEQRILSSLSPPTGGAASSDTKLLERIAELREAGAEEGVSVNDESETDLKTFAAAFGEPLAVFLLDSGNFRARWHNAALSSALEFKGNGDVRVLHLPRTALTKEKHDG